MQEINLYHLLKFYASKWKTILVWTVASLAIGFLYTMFAQVPMYKSSATLILINPTNQSTTTDSTLINNYLELFKSRRVLEPVITSHNLNISYDDLAKSTDATNAKDTAVINVTIATKSPNTSKSLVEGAIISFKKQVKELYSTDNIQIVDDANFDAKPYNVNVVMQLILSSVAGLIISIIYLFFVYDIKFNKDYKKTEESINSLEKAIDKFISINTNQPDTSDKIEKKLQPISADDADNHEKIKIAREQWLRALSSAKRRIKR